MASIPSPIKTLHQINQPEKLNTALAVAAKGDVLLFIEAATSLVFNQQLISELAKNYQLASLQQDLTAAGITCPAEITSLSDTAWVELSLKAEQIICW